MKAKKRNSLPKTSFVYKKQRKYPIDTKKRAKAALSYSARKDTYGSYSTVRKAVNRRYPSLRRGGAKRKRASRKRKRKGG